MPLTKPNQELKRDQKAAAFNLEHADTLALMMLIRGLYAGEDRLTAYVAEIAGERIVRGKPE